MVYQPAKMLLDEFNKENVRHMIVNSGTIATVNAEYFLEGGKRESIYLKFLELSNVLSAKTGIPCAWILARPKIAYVFSENCNLEGKIPPCPKDGLTWVGKINNMNMFSCWWLPEDVTLLGNLRPGTAIHGDGFRGVARLSFSGFEKKFNELDIAAWGNIWEDESKAMGD